MLVAVYIFSALVGFGHVVITRTRVTMCPAVVRCCAVADEWTRQAFFQDNQVSLLDLARFSCLCTEYEFLKSLGPSYNL